MPNYLGFPIERALKQAKQRKECERAGGHDWEEPKRLDGFDDGAWITRECKRCRLLEFIEKAT